MTKQITPINYDRYTANSRNAYSCGEITAGEFYFIEDRPELLDQFRKRDELIMAYFRVTQHLQTSLRSAGLHEAASSLQKPINTARPLLGDLIDETS